MSWVNLDDVYVNKSGDSIAGNLSVGGTLTINDGKGTDTTYNVANEITTLRDSVSQMQKGDIIQLYGGVGMPSNIYIQRVGHTCTLVWKVSQPSSDYWAIDYAIPEGLRPADALYIPSCVTNQNGYVLNACAYCYINPNGTIGFQVATSISGAMNNGICSWIIK